MYQIIPINIAFFYFLCGIIELWYSIKYNEYYNECNNIWTIIVFSSVINIITSIIICIKLSLISRFNYYIDSNNIIIYFLQIFICGISALIYLNTTINCSIFWKKNANELLTFIYIQYILFWFIASIIIINILYGLTSIGIEMYNRNRNIQFI